MKNLLILRDLNLPTINDTSLDLYGGTNYMYVSIPVTPIQTSSDSDKHFRDTDLHLDNVFGEVFWHGGEPEIPTVDHALRTSTAGRAHGLLQTLVNHCVIEICKTEKMLI